MKITIEQAYEVWKDRATCMTLLPTNGTSSEEGVL